MPSRKLQVGIAVAVALAVVASFFVFANPFMTSTSDSTNPLDAALGQQASVDASSSQLVAQDEAVGTGATAKTGDIITVNYTGKLQDGTVFDTSVGKTPYTFTLGTGTVIPGWDQGLQGMKVGGKRLLIIPPSLAYGAQDYGPIPGNSTLIFEVELLGVSPTGQ